ncbi:MAG: hypothetical protein AAF267_21790 [Deinococcota bacterium]
MKNILTAVFVTIIALASNSFAQSPNHSETTVFNYADAAEIEGTYSQLIRSENTIAVELKTSGLMPREPYTIWWVIFNEPTACSEACDGDDIFAADGSMSLNEMAEISILFADGAMSDADGNGNFSAVLTEDRPFGQVLAGPGLTDTQNAEVHLVVRHHGDLIPELAYEQLSLGSACSDCYKQDVQFAVHQAPAALADN